MLAGRIFRYVCAAALCLGLMGCSKEGPTGPPGPQGKQGQPGDPGSAIRTVYTGTVTADAATSGGQIIDIPELDLSSFPLVAVYVLNDDGNWFLCSLFDSYYDSVDQKNYINIEERAYLRNGHIFLFSAFSGNPYRVVIVK